MDAKEIKKDPDKLKLHIDYSFLHGVNFKDRIIIINDDLDFDLFTKVDAAMTEMERDSKKAITIKIVSFGGLVHSALAVVGRMRKSPCRIITEGYGAIMSGAALIFAAGDKRRISKYAWYMWHEVWYGDENRHSAMKAMVIQADKEMQLLAKSMEEFSNKSASFWLKHGMHIDAYFSAEQLVGLGVADEIF